MKTLQIVENLLGTERDIHKALLQFAEIRLQQKQLEVAEKALRPLIENHLRMSPHHEYELDGLRFTLINQTRENFSLKEARTALCEDLLAPFISVSAYNTIRIKEAKDE